MAGAKAGDLWVPLDRRECREMPRSRADRDGRGVPAIGRRRRARRWRSCPTRASAGRRSGRRRTGPRDGRRGSRPCGTRRRPRPPPLPPPPPRRPTATATATSSVFSSSKRFVPRGARPEEAARVSVPGDPTGGELFVRGLIGLRIAAGRWWWVWLGRFFSPGGGGSEGGREGEEEAGSFPTSLLLFWMYCTFSPTTTASSSPLTTSNQLLRN